MFRDLITKMHGNLVVLRNLPGQRDIPYLPRKQLESLRDARLRSIVRYAAENVPYYQNLFQREGIDPSAIRSIGDLEYFPLVDKDTVRKNPALFRSNSRLGKESIPFVTSGTTGEPLTVYHDPYSLLANIAFGEREREVLTRMCGKRFGYKEMYILRPQSTLEKVGIFYKRRTFVPVRPERLIRSSGEPMDEIVDAINHFQPDVIIGYGSHLETLFRTVNSKNIALYLPRLLLYGADAMTSEGRIFIENKMGIPVLSHYDAVEAFKIGFSCEERRGFHLHEDLCHLKVVDSRGERVVDGEKGELVISNLANRGSVLLNYRLGDVGSLSTRKCPCGRTLPILEELEGRSEDILFLADGRFIHPRGVWEVLSRRDGILRYQLIQCEAERFELRLVTVDQNAYVATVGGILADLKSLLGASATIHAQYCEELKPHAGGKFRAVLSHCQKQNLLS
jgi:phenylacetate-CoA ligase